MDKNIYVRSIDELINLFPSNTDYVEVDRDEVQQLVNDIIKNAKNYHDIYNIIYEYVNKNIFNEKDYYNSKPTPEKRANYELFNIWFYGYYDYKKEEYEKYNIPIPSEDFLSVYDWINAFENFYISTKGPIRKYEEAVEIAVDEWMKIIFNDVNQDPDRLSCDKSSNPITSFLGNKAKNMYMKDITEEHKNNMRKYLREFYMDNGATYDCWRPSLSVDYAPDGVLMNIYKKAGIDTNTAESISPWKTIILIDRKDNSVCINHKYF